MTRTTAFRAGTIAADLLGRTPLDDALDDLRVTGAILLHEAYAPPWAIDVPGEAEMRRLLHVGTEARILPFHLVRHGGFRLAHAGLAATQVSADEVAICPSGAPHRIFDGRGGRAVSLAAILAGDGPPPGGRDTGETELVCGVFLLRAMPLSPLLAALPPLLTLSTGAGNPALAGVANLLTLERDTGPRGRFTAARMLEVFCAEAIRAYGLGNDALAPGWFRGLRDDRIARAIAVIHRAPASPWTVASLAAHAAMSVSRFAALFRAETGRSVMAYVATWRMNVACRMLTEGDMPLARVAAAAGYEDAAAFSRAFRALVGDSPAHWRDSMRAGLRGERAGS